MVCTKLHIFVTIFSHLPESVVLTWDSLILAMCGGWLMAIHGNDSR